MNKYMEIMQNKASKKQKVITEKEFLESEKQEAELLRIEKETD